MKGWKQDILVFLDEEQDDDMDIQFGESLSDERLELDEMDEVPICLTELFD